MSIEATKWARAADVQKSSSKAVLLELAHQVRYDSSEWTAFASIEHLSRVTHLNRKTVIEALGRLRELGAIIDTQLRAGPNRSCPVYRLCPANVPVVQAAGARADAGAFPAARTVPPITQQHPIPEADDRPGEAPDDSAGREADAQARPPEPTAVPDISPPAAPCPLTASVEEPDTVALPLPDGRHQATAVPHVSRSHAREAVAPARAVAPSSAGAGPTRLPEDWTLPARWREWTQRERPHWDDSKIRTVEVMFAAYWRSKPGNEGLSGDWYESWRLWVFRERDGQRGAGDWHASASGIEQKARELNLPPQGEYEPFPVFRARVHQAAGVPIPKPRDSGAQ